MAVGDAGLPDLLQHYPDACRVPLNPDECIAGALGGHRLRGIVLRLVGPNALLKPRNKIATFGKNAGESYGKKHKYLITFH